MMKKLKKKKLGNDKLLINIFFLDDLIRDSIVITYSIIPIINNTPFKNFDFYYLL